MGNKILMLLNIYFDCNKNIGTFIQTNIRRILVVNKGIILFKSKKKKNITDFDAIMNTAVKNNKTTLLLIILC